MSKETTLIYIIAGIFAIIYSIGLFYSINESKVVYTKPTTMEPEKKIATSSTTAQNFHNSTSTSTEELLNTSTTTSTTSITNKPATSTSDKASKVVTNPKPAPTKTVANNPPETVNATISTKDKTVAKVIVEEKPIVTTSRKLSWGAYTGPVPESILTFEKKVNANPDYIAHFVHWGNGDGNLPTWLYEHTYAKDRTLVIFWEASDYLIGGTNQPKFSYRTILNGNHDDYITSFAKQIKAYKGPVILIPFSELNGNWTPWSGTKNGNTPEEAVLAFRYVHGFFNNVPNVKFGLAVNAASVPNIYENRIDAYYPGHEYVDYVGVDGFNMGQPWESFSDIFSQPLNTLSKYNKPMFIFSFGSAEGVNKAQWLDDALNVQMTKYPLLKGFVYFNQNKERNWLLWSDQKTLSVFNDYVSE
ncbi:MAG: hypothetical protein KBC78_01900 [Candidatus Pacebacteria bacterium]|jgi:beta-mannanase|nr:hypothetical protein [Candidatus Paceibacterota bacterium]